MKLQININNSIVDLHVITQYIYNCHRRHTELSQSAQLPLHCQQIYSDVKV